MTQPVQARNVSPDQAATGENQSERSATDQAAGPAHVHQLARLILASFLAGATGAMLAITGVWALTFHGVIGNDLKAALGGHTLTSAGVLLLVLGLVLLGSSIGAVIEPKVNRWIGVMSRVLGVLAASAVAISGIWLVKEYPGWAMAYTALGALIAFTMTSYDRELHSAWPWASLRAEAAKVFALNTRGINVPRGVALAGLLLMTFVVTSSLHYERYFLSVAFGLLFVTLSDPGGDYLPRLRRMAFVALGGFLMTALGFGIGGDAWGYSVLAVFLATVLFGLIVNIDLHALVAGVLLNVWLLITLSASSGLSAKVSPRPWNQALAWLVGAGIAAGLTSVLWLLRGRTGQPSPLPEVPADLPPIKLSRPIVMFVLIRALAVSGAVAIAFGLHETNADWMPLAALVAMKPTLEQSTIRGVQRLVGTTLGAGLAAVFLVSITSIRALEEIVVLLMGIGMSLYAVNYALYTLAIAGAVLITLDIPHPTNLAAEGRRILFTLAGIGIAIVVMALASLLQQRKAGSAQEAPQTAPQRVTPSITQAQAS